MARSSQPGVTDNLPEELPPVKPPSVGFIVQLFVVPGLIVGAIVGIWLLFGRMATAEQDWQRLVLELQNPNEHRRWRGAMGLAQILKADLELGDKGQHLSEKPEFVEALTKMLGAELDRNGQRPEDLQFQSFLTQTFSLLDSPAAALPVLSQALAPTVDREVRKNALLSLAVMVDRLKRRGESLNEGEIASRVLPVCQDTDPLIRSTAAYLLGLLEDPTSRDRLKGMLDDGDQGVKLNAAIALVRHNDRSGVAQLTEVLSTANEPFEGRYSDQLAQFLAVKNSLTAMGQLKDLLTDQEKGDLKKVIQPIADSFREAGIRVLAQSTLQSLDAL